MATAIAHPNFALIKYWGKSNHLLNIPAAGSISVTVDKLTTETTVDFSAGLERDAACLNGKQVKGKEMFRLQTFLNIFRKIAGEDRRAEIISSNNFPTAAGIASSSSGFAALSLAASSSLGLRLAPDELSETDIDVGAEGMKFSADKGGIHDSIRLPQTV